MKKDAAIRLRSEEEEYTRLDERAAKSAEARRLAEEEECFIRTRFQRDRDRILHSKPFRRLKHKTQVYIAAAGDHYRTRMTHSLEVSQISRTVGRALRLNEDLIEAIALGHDVGHTPFGHVGESALDALLGHFAHNEQSLRTLTILTGDGRGLNLTEPVRDGVLNHTGPTAPRTLEGQIVKIGDRIAYLCHDYDDAVRAGLMTGQDLPAEVCAILGETPSAMITSMVSDAITQSAGQSEIRLSDTVRRAMDIFRNAMFEIVYNGPSLRQERRKGQKIIEMLFEYCRNNKHVLPEEYLTWANGSVERAAADYLAGCTDKYAIHWFQDLFVPQPHWPISYEKI